MKGPAVQEVLKRGPVKGYVLQMDVASKVPELVPQHLSVRGNNGRGSSIPRRERVVSDQTMEAFYAAVPAQVRREARERKEAMVRRLIADAIAWKRATGKVGFPRSIEDEIRLLGAMEGNPKLLDQVEALSIPAVERYVDWQIEKTAVAQRKEDQHRVVRDWHGHLSM